MNNKDHRYVVSYYCVKYRFGSSAKSLVDYAEKHGLTDTIVLYRIREDGIWEQIPFIKEKKEKKNETL